MEKLLTLLPLLVILLVGAEIWLLLEHGPLGLMLGLLVLATLVCVVDCRYRPNVAQPDGPPEVDL